MKRKDKDIKRGFRNIPEYLSKDLKGVARNAFERILQKDDFASEAIEGLSGLSAGEYKNDIKLLNSRINKRTSLFEGSLIYRIAASVAVLMIISSVFLIVERNRTSLKVEEGSVSYLEITKSNPLTKTYPEKEPESTENGLPENELPGYKEKKAVTQKREAANEAKESIVSAASLQKADEAEPPVAQEPEAPVTRSKGIEQEQKGLPAPAAILNESTAARMQPQKEETVVVGYGEMKSELVRNAVTGYSPAKPIIGIDSFKIYIRKNLYILDTLTPSIAKITTGFRVMKDGTIDSIRVIKSPDQAFTEKVKKLIKEGPAWQSAENNGMPVDDDVTISIDLK
ncbi:MAG TPA: hypothetical protein VHO50_03100 [Bacteroidales bacterium]|nr:hypothetical protein [Bacteroidales bacterium]